MRLIDKAGVSIIMQKWSRVIPILYFSCVLNLTTHFHMLLLDGLYIKCPL